jgi:hypothetical protein
MLVKLLATGTTVEDEFSTQKVKLLIVIIIRVRTAANIDYGFLGCEAGYFGMFV